jgi:hypothetical protein
MIRSIRQVSAACSVWIPGLKGPAEPFDSAALPRDSEFWAAVESYYRRCMVWDCGKRDIVPQSEEIAEGVQIAIVRLLSTTVEQWAKMKIGRGDRWRAIVAVRAFMRRSGWRAGSGHRQEKRKYRPYPTGGHSSLPGPVAVAVAVEEATAGIQGKARGSRHVTAGSLSAADARAAVLGYSTERRLGAIHVSGGVCSVETDGTMQHVETRRWIENHREEDGTVVQLTIAETAPRMVPGYSRREFAAGYVYDSAEW